MAPEMAKIPLHTNGSEKDIRCHVTKRAISGGTRSDAGRDCRATFLASLETCVESSIAFWNYVRARLDVQGSLPIPELAKLVSVNPPQPH